MDLPAPDGATVRLRQIHRQAADGAQIPILTSRTDLPAAQLCWRLAGRWRQENYFKYAREHFALDALDSYADLADDPDRLAPNPATRRARAAVDSARAAVAAAEAGLSAAIDDAVARARRPGSGATATVDAAAEKALGAARDRLHRATATARATPGHLPLRDVRPDARLLDEERKLLTHAIRMAAYNAETTLARMLRPHYARADDEARALLREAMTLSGDLHVVGDTLNVRLDPATAPPPQPRPRCPLRTAHRDPDPLPRHQTQDRLQREGPAPAFMIQLIRSGVLGPAPAGRRTTPKIE